MYIYCLCYTGYMNEILKVLVVAGSMVLIDGVWLATMTSRFYKKNLGNLLAEKANFLAAGLFYAIYVVGVLVIIINPALENKYSYVKTFVHGALFGLVAYSTYDLTNQATLKNWPVIVTIVDMLWGALLTGLVSVVALRIIKAL